MVNGRLGRELGRAEEYALEEGGTVELDGELLEVRKVSGENIGFSHLILAVLQKHLHLTFARGRSSVLNFYECFSVFILTLIICMEG